MPLLGREGAELLSTALAAVAALPVLHPDWRWWGVRKAWEL